MNYHFEDFTETEYRKLVRLARENWKIVPFTERRKAGKICLWRHDMDLSPHRARRLAEIESEEGLSATYLVLLHSTFYCALEKEIREIIKGIARLGHDIGLHFDPGFYGAEELEGNGLGRLLAFEKNVLETAIGVRVSAISFHNSEKMPPAVKPEDEEVAGMVNTSSRYIREKFGYCSDSNGYWRFRRLREVLESGVDQRLHVLTHPGWWVPEVMSPRERVARCINGRANTHLKYYESAMADYGRTNVS
jgi:hypothetical protein